MFKWISVPASAAAASGIGVGVIFWAVFGRDVLPFTWLLLTSGMSVFAGVVVFSLYVQKKIARETVRLESQIDKIMRLEAVDSHSDNGYVMLLGVHQRLCDRVDEYRKTIRDVLTTSDKVAIGSAEISYFLDKLQGSINENVSSSNQISVATEEITQTTGVISQTADNASRVVDEARNYSDEGIQAVEQMNSQIHNFKNNVQVTADNTRYLSELSGKIQNITQVINGVAEQTNLLALNAAIEAARAGEHGRGFAVVADEVRSLANQTTGATGEIGQMLEEIKQQTEHSVRNMEELETGVTQIVSMSDNTRQTFANIQQSSRETVDKINEITNILKEHVTASSEISSSVAGISGQLQETSDRSKEIAEESYSLSETGERLADLLSDYELGTRHETVRNLALEAATKISETFEQSINNGEISEADLFDRDYQPIPETYPQKFSTKFDKYTDRVLPAIQEPILTQCDGILFAGAVDNNGYFPTHNKRYSQPLTGNYDQDLNNNRTKRIFDDRTGSRCGSNQERFLLQTYKRDTGEIIHDVSAPIYINGRHWGGFRIGYKNVS